MFKNLYQKVYLVSDSIDPIINQENGKVYDSKSKYYADLKASGHVVVDLEWINLERLGVILMLKKDVARALGTIRILKHTRNEMTEKPLKIN